MEKITKTNWAFIVKAKTSSKMHPFQTLEAAEAFAKENSNKRVCYTVWQEGKCISAFKANKKLPETNIIASYYPETRDSAEIYSKISLPQNKKWRRVCTDVYCVSVEKCENKVRLVRTYKELYLTKNNGHVCRFSRETTTLRSDGRAFFHYKGQFLGEDSIYFSDEYDNEIGEEFREALIELRPELKQLINNCKKLKDVVNTFTHPNFLFITDDYKHSIRRRWPTCLPKRLFPHQLTNENALIEAITKRAKAPLTKGLKKLYVTNDKNICYAAGIARCGIKDVNNIYKLSSLGAYVDGQHHKHFEDLVRFIVKVRGENWFTKHFTTEPLSQLVDTARMVGAYEIDEDVIRFVVENMRNFHELHDTIQASSRYAKVINRTIKYDEKEIKRFNRQYDDISFALAENTKDLAIIGAEMGICVGGYGNEAVSRRCTIVKMMHGNKYAACIEVRNDNVYQIKAKFNNMLQLEYKDVLDTWLRQAKLTVACSDYENMGEPWSSRYNYAHINPNNFVEENEPSVLRMVKADPTIRPVKDCWADKRENHILLPWELDF